MTHNIYVLVSCVQQSDSVKQTYIIPYDLLKNIYLAASGLSCGPQDLSFGVWDLAPQSGIEPRSPALGTQSLNHWTNREVPNPI